MWYLLLERWENRREADAQIYLAERDAAGTGKHHGTLALERWQTEEPGSFCSGWAEGILRQRQPVSPHYIPNCEAPSGGQHNDLLDYAFHKHWNNAWGFDYKIWSWKLPMFHCAFLTRSPQRCYVWLSGTRCPPFAFWGRLCRAAWHSPPGSGTRTNNIEQIHHHNHNYTAAAPMGLTQLYTETAPTHPGLLLPTWLTRLWTEPVYLLAIASQCVIGISCVFHLRLSAQIVANHCSHVSFTFGNRMCSISSWASCDCSTRHNVTVHVNSGATVCCRLA